MMCDEFEYVSKSDLKLDKKNFKLLKSYHSNQCYLIDSTDKAMVLKHHPDKRKAAGEPIKDGDNDYFTCITKGKAMAHPLLSESGAFCLERLL